MNIENVQIGRKLCMPSGMIKIDSKGSFARLFHLAHSEVNSLQWEFEDEVCALDAQDASIRPMLDAIEIVERRNSGKYYRVRPKSSFIELSSYILDDSLVLCGYSETSRQQTELLKLSDQDFHRRWLLNADIVACNLDGVAWGLLGRNALVFEAMLASAKVAGATDEDDFSLDEALLIWGIV